MPDHRTPAAPPVPLLYGGTPDAADDTPLITPSEEEMAQHLAAQLTAAQREAEQARAKDEAAAAAMPAGTRPAEGALAAAAPAVVTPGEAAAQAAALAAELAAELAALGAARRDAQAASGAAPGAASSALPWQGTGAARASTAEPPPRQLGGYSLKARIQRGGSTPAYRAQDAQGGREVVLQLLVAARCEDDVVRDRLLAGARAAARLSHPHIVPIRAVAEAEGRPFIVTDLGEGQTLAQRLEEHPRLPVQEVLAIALPLARALAHAHEHGVVHRDVHARHVLLLPEGRGVQLGGFGVVQGGSGSGIPPLGPTWPEQVRGEAVGSPGDQFLLGALMYEMLTGRRPFHGDSPAAVALNLGQEEPPPLIQVRPDLPAPLRRVVDRCLAKQPAQRYESTQALASALLRAQDEINAKASQQQQPRRLPLRVQAALATGGLAAALLGLSASLVVPALQGAAATQAAAQARATAAVVAAQAASQVLTEEWPAVEQQVQDAMRSGSLSSLVVTDAAGTVRAASQPALVGQAYAASGQAVPALAVAGSPVHRLGSGDGAVLVFETPVLYQGKPLGRVMLGITEAPQQQWARQAWLLVLGAAGAVALGLALAAYLLAGWVTRPLRTLADGLADIGQGRFDQRLSAGRWPFSEAADAAQSFDAMAQALARRDAGPGAGAAGVNASPGPAPATPKTASSPAKRK